MRSVAQGAAEPDPSPGSPDLELRLCPYASIKGLQKKKKKQGQHTIYPQIKPDPHSWVFRRAATGHWGQ